MIEVWWYLQWLLERSFVQGLIVSALVMCYVQFLTNIDWRLHDDDE